MPLSKAAAVGVLLAGLAAPVLAAAQAARPAHDVSVFVGVGGSTDLGDWGGSPVTWSAGGRYGLTRHFALDGEVGRWREQRNYDFLADWSFDFPVYEPARQVSVEGQTQWHGAVTLVARTGPRRASVWAGLGAAYFYQTGETSSDVTRVSDQRHKQWTHGWRSQGLGAFGKAGVDVRMTRQIGLFVEGRGSLGMMVDTILLGAHAGVRVTF